MQNKAAIPNPALRPLSALVGTWTTTGRHPAVPNETLHGRTSFEWFEGGAFLLMRSHLEDPRFPDGVAILGSDGDSPGEFFMLYFDERGVSRKYDFRIGGDEWSWWRDAKSLSQRFRCTITDEGRTMTGYGEMSKDGGSTWEKDLDVTYRRLA